MIPDACDLLQRVRLQKPVIHHLTNWVTTYDCAQIVKTLGASPVMAHAREEMVEMTQIASALVLNIGTLTVDFVEAMKLAAHSANRRVIPVILDVCGAGATRLRGRKCVELMNAARMDVIKGNRSEIASICGKAVLTRGVDSTDVASLDIVSLAQKLAQQRQTTVVVTGEEDVVTDGAQTYLVKNGHPMMTSVVGTGCMATSVIASFCAVEPEICTAAAYALTCYGIAAELAVKQSAGPASFKTKLFDAFYHLDRKTISARQKLAKTKVELTSKKTNPQRSGAERSIEKATLGKSISN